MDTELKPCPFCGGRDQTFGPPERPYTLDRDDDMPWRIECEDCATVHHSGDSKQAVAESWNRRAPDPVTAELVEALEDLYARVAGECGCSLYRDESDADFNLDQRIRAALAKAAQREG